jgi:hypothetical protein
MDLLRMAEEGLDAYEALQIYLKSLLVPLPPSRYEVSSPIVRPVPRVVAVLEIGGKEIDRVAIEEYQSLREAEERVAQLNALPREARTPVRFYPYQGEELNQLWDQIAQIVHLDMENYLGHPFRRLMGVGWKVPTPPEQVVDDPMKALLQRAFEGLVKAGLDEEQARSRLADLEVCQDGKWVGISYQGVLLALMESGRGWRWRDVEKRAEAIVRTLSPQQKEPR